jgi:hypothetical protein
MIPKPAAVQTFRNKLTNHTQYTEIVDATTYKTKAHIKETVQRYNGARYSARCSWASIYITKRELRMLMVIDGKVAGGS